MKNTLRIGIDFDNTIICYDDLFEKAVCEKKWNIGLISPVSKSFIKNRLIEIDGNDKRWQEIQAIVYGILIKHAKPFSGLIETLEFLTQNTIVELFVVSHKTKNSNYIPEITFIDKALDWIEAQKLYQFIPKDHFYFLPTRDEKIETISSLNLDYFIDDLLEVFDDSKFPQINKLFFSPEGNELNSWWRIKNHFQVLHEIGKDNLNKINSFATAPFLNFEFIKRDGNNKIIQFSDSVGKEFVIKKYSQLNNSYSTLETEFTALELLKKSKLPVPTPFFKNSVEGLALYERIQSAESKPSSAEIISEFSSFLIQLSKLSSQFNNLNFVEARDSRSKIIDYKNHVQRRLDQIEAGCSANDNFVEIQTFINDTFKPLHQQVLNKYNYFLKKFQLDENNPITQNQKILSPSDFGTHNAIYNRDKKFTFIDFEYFGWDDPVKLVADFLHHAGQDISQKERFSILKLFSKEAILDPQFFMRLTTVLDLVGLEWILIILNIASPEVLKRRMYANPNLIISNLVKDRLLKASERANLFHVNLKSNSVFFSLEPNLIQLMEIPAWQQLII